MKQKMVEQVLNHAQKALLQRENIENSKKFFISLKLCEILGFRSGAIKVFVLEG